MSASMAVAGLLATAAPAVSVTPAEYVAALNADREAHGLPGGIVEDPALSRGCALHNRYLQANAAGGHDEDPALPAHTPEGAAAGRSSVLWSSSGEAPRAGLSPFRAAPMHLMQLLDPRLLVTGVDHAADAGRHRLCVVTLGTTPRPYAAVDALLPFPGDGTPAPARETAREEPFVPGDLVGLPEGTETGPHLYVLADGPFALGRAPMSVVEASLAGPDGPVEIRSVTNATPGIGPYLPPGAILIPVAPLATGVHRARVTLANPQGVTVTRAWSFRAEGGRAPVPPPPPPPPPSGTASGAAATAFSRPAVTVRARVDRTRRAPAIRVAVRISPPRAGVPVRAATGRGPACRARTDRRGRADLRCVVRRPGTARIRVRVAGTDVVLRAVRVTPR